MELFTSISNTLQKSILKFRDRNQPQKNSVSTKLHLLNFLILISSVVGIIGAYEIQMGGKMHELNYFHQKYITQLVKAVDQFENNSTSIDNVRKNILLVREQPIQCIELIGSVELFMMTLVGTKNTLNICHVDLAIADNLLKKTQEFEIKILDNQTFIELLHIGIKGFEHSGESFEPLVTKTVKVTFFIVISILIAKAFIVPLIGWVLSNGVSRDYKLLLETKVRLEEEKRHNALIQSERLASLTTMVAGMAHEINTPVGVSITANSYTEDALSNLKKSYENEELTETKFNNFIKQMEQSTKMVTNNLSRTASLVTSFKQISVDQTVDDLQNIKFKSYIEQVLISLTPIIKSSHVTFKLSCDENLEVCIYAGLFSQILTNLVTNAIRHGFKNKDSGMITIVVKELPENEILFSFQDDGCGISELDKVHIFDPFFTTQRGKGGTGLGLHILHNLVTEKFNGRISCISQLNSGARFEIFFPNTRDEKDNEMART